MAAGEMFPAEWTEYKDPVSGARVRQLTSHKAHSHHLYFTNPGWYDGGRKLLFGSDRENRTNLYSLDLESGGIRQLTDLEPAPAPWVTSFLRASLNPKRPEAYFWHGRRLCALDLGSLEIKAIFEIDPEFVASMTNVSADGRYVLAGVYENLSKRFKVDLLHGYVGFKETWEARPLSRIYKVPTDGEGEAVAVREERCWIGHVNTSPALPDVLTFCHEGPWNMVDNRIWGLDTSSGKVWKIRATSPGERVGHEYWFADGERVGYHGSAEGKGAFFGSVRHDDADRREFEFPVGSTHFHSLDENLVVGDGDRDRPYIFLWRLREGSYEGPRTLCLHRTSFHIQIVHAHPRFNRDGSQVLFTSDRKGYGSPYLVDVPPFDELPPYEG